jgi:hypothetical protein
MAAAVAVLAVCRRQAGVGCLLLPLQSQQQQQPQQPPLLQRVIQGVLHVGRMLSTLPPVSSFYPAGDLFNFLWEIPQLAEQPQMAAALQQLLA